MSNALDSYKPQVSILKTFEVDEALPDNELTFDIFKKLVTARKLQDVVFLSIGKLLKIVRDRKLYKFLDFEHFEQFLASEELSFSREKAYMYIRIYEFYSEFLQIKEEAMRDFSIVRLSLMMPILKKLDSKEEQLDKIEEMKALRYNDFIVDVKKSADNDRPVIYYSNETSKWIVQYYNDRTSLIDKGVFKAEEDANT